MPTVLCNHSRHFGMCSDCPHDKPHDPRPEPSKWEGYDCQDGNPCEVNGMVPNCRCVIVNPEG